MGVEEKVRTIGIILAGLRALLGAPSKITATAEGQVATGGLVLIGNGRLYGGPFRIFPQADLRDGLLDLCIFPRVNWFTLARCGPQLLLYGSIPVSAVEAFQAKAIHLTASAPTPLEIDGELIGHLPLPFP